MVLSKFVLGLSSKKAKAKHARDINSPEDEIRSLTTFMKGLASGASPEEIEKKGAQAQLTNLSGNELRHDTVREDAESETSTLQKHKRRSIKQVRGKSQAYLAHVNNFAPPKNHVPVAPSSAVEDDGPPRTPRGSNAYIVSTMDRKFGSGKSRRPSWNQPLIPKGRPVSKRNFRINKTSMNRKGGNTDNKDKDNKANKVTAQANQRQAPAQWSPSQVTTQGNQSNEDGKKDDGKKKRPVSVRDRIQKYQGETLVRQPKKTVAAPAAEQKKARPVSVNRTSQSRPGRNSNAQKAPAGEGSVARLSKRFSSSPVVDAPKEVVRKKSMVKPKNKSKIVPPVLPKRTQRANKEESESTVSRLSRRFSSNKENQTKNEDKVAPKVEISPGSVATLSRRFKPEELPAEIQEPPRAKKAWKPPLPKRDVEVADIEDEKPKVTVTPGISTRVMSFAGRRTLQVPPAESKTIEKPKQSDTEEDTNQESVQELDPAVAKLQEKLGKNERVSTSLSGDVLNNFKEKLEMMHLGISPRMSTSSRVSTSSNSRPPVGQLDASKKAAASQALDNILGGRKTHPSVVQNDDVREVDAETKQAALSALNDLFGKKMPPAM